MKKALFDILDVLNTSATFYGPVLARYLGHIQDPLRVFVFRNRGRKGIRFQSALVFQNERPLFLKRPLFFRPQEPRALTSVQTPTLLKDIEVGGGSGASLHRLPSLHSENGVPNKS